MKELSADVVVLGSGPAGYVCAIRLAQLGKKVTVVERAELGGVCLNRGCIPSKALIYAGGLIEKITHAQELGITVEGVKVDFPKLVKWKDSVVSKLTAGVGGLLKANGCTVVKGDAKFTSPKSLQVKTPEGDLNLTFNSCVIAAGSRPLDLSAKIPGLTVDQKHICDSTGALSMEKIPGRLLCVGGGYIGLELGTFFAKIGTQVTVVEAMPQILSGVDADLTKVVEKRLGKLGVHLKLRTELRSVKVGKSGVEATFFASETGKQETQIFDAVLVTVGRKSNADLIGLEKTGLTADAQGFIKVDAQRRTSVPHLFAIGDIAGQPLLAHKGSKEGIVAAEAIAGLKTVYDVAAMPAVIFTDPEIATVGMTEGEAAKKGLKTKVGVFPFAANGRALSVNEPDGFVKMVCEAQSGRVLGVHIVGAEASNLISEAVLAIEMGATAEDIALSVHPHPTLPETLMEAAEAAMGHAIHIFQPKKL